MNVPTPNCLDLSRFNNVAQAIAIANQWGSAPAIVDLDRNVVYSHSDLARRIGEYGSGFTERGFQKGDSLATNIENGADLTVLILACLAFGLRLALIEPQTPAAKLDRFVDMVGPRALIAEVASILSGSLPILTPAELVGKGTPPPFPDIGVDDDAIVIFSSGTTGAPKGIVHSHGNILAEVGSMIRGYGCSNLRRHRLVLTLAHVSGLYRGLLMPFFSAGTIYIRRNFSAESYWKDVIDYAIDFVQLVPSHVAILNRSEGPSEKTVLKLIGTASAYLPPKEQLAFETRFGIPILQGYGLTECTCGITLNSLDPTLRKPGTAGRPLDVNKIRIVDSAGIEVDIGEVGELQVKGPNIARRFLGFEGPEFDGEWLKTGDMGRQAPDGNITLLGRKTNIVNRGAYKIYTLEVEEALRKFSDVTDAAVIGVPHPLLGEDVIGFVTPSHGSEPFSLLGKLRAQLASYKIPTKIMRLESLPRNHMGKVLRDELLRIGKDGGMMSVLPKGADLELKLCQMLASLFGRDPAAVTVHLSRDVEPRWDSLGHVQVIAAVEQEFGIALEPNAAFAVRTIGDLAALIEYVARPANS